MKEKYPATPPRRRLTEEEQSRLAAQEAADRVAAGLPAAAAVELSPEEQTAAEREKQALLEALHTDTRIAKKTAARQPVAQDRGGRHGHHGVIRERLAAMPPAEPAPDEAEVKAELSAAKTALAEAEEAIRQAEAEAERQKTARERRIESLRQELGAAQQKEESFVKARAAAELRARAQEIERSAEANRRAESSDEEAARLAYVERAKVLSGNVVATLRELIAFEDQNGAALTKLGKTRWEDLPAEWRVQDRTAFVDRVATPAREAASNLKSKIDQGQRLLVELEQAGHPHSHLRRDWVEARAAKFGKSTIRSSVEAVGVINTEAQRITQAATKHIQPGVRPRIIIRPRPLTVPDSSASVDTAFDPHA